MLWKLHMFQALIKKTAKSQSLKTTWKDYTIQAFIKSMAKSQTPKCTGKWYRSQIITEGIIQCEALQCGGQNLKLMICFNTFQLGHTFQNRFILIERQALDQCPGANQIHWKIHIWQACRFLCKSLFPERFVHGQFLRLMQQRDAGTSFGRNSSNNQITQIAACLRLHHSQSKSLPIQTYHTHIQAMATVVQLHGVELSEKLSCDTLVTATGKPTEMHISSNLFSLWSTSTPEGFDIRPDMEDIQLHIWLHEWMYICNIL